VPLSKTSRPKLIFKSSYIARFAGEDTLDRDGGGLFVNAFSTILVYW
jgi:hypothetical protein